MCSISNIYFIFKFELHVHCDLLGISIVVCIVLAVYEFYTCIVHLTFLFVFYVKSSRQDNFTLLSHGKQVDGTEEEVFHREPPHHLQAHRGFLTSSPNLVRTCSDTAMEDQVIRSQ